MKAGWLLAVVLVLLAAVLLWRTTWHEHAAQAQTPAAGLQLPVLSDADYAWIAAGIFRNETAGKVDNLTYWGAGEDFPSLGIGHFIWFPTAVDAPFDEQFPDMVAYLQQVAPAGLAMPAWLQELEPFDAPWNSKAQFDEAWPSAEMTALREWLAATQSYQARFIVAAFARRWQSLELPAGQKQALTDLLQALVATPEGLFAVIDYYNFKGLGDNPRERYRDEGWGLVQVLMAMTRAGRDSDGRDPDGQESDGRDPDGQDSDVQDPDGQDAHTCASVVTRFRDAAAGRLRLRVELSPPDRNESRWLAGWLKRLDGYTDTTGNDRFGDCGFRVTPWLQNPDTHAMTLMWLGNSSRAGQLTLWQQDQSADSAGAVFDSSPVPAKALDYHPAEKCDDPGCRRPRPPYLHQLRISDLRPGTDYRYRVTQDGVPADGAFTTPDDGDRPLRFIVYADSETEPESTGTAVAWPGADRATRKRKYLVDQSTGYQQNLQVIRARQPAFVAIAGDLVQSGGEQRDWDEFWLQNAPLAAQTVLLPALGNHEYFGGPGELGQYSAGDSERAVRKYQTYFDLPANHADHAWLEERYYALRYGVVTLIVLDTNDGLPDGSAMDTNWRLRGAGDGGYAPDWQPGSGQYAWLEVALRQAQQTSRFTFVMTHGSPYTSGVHGQPPGDTRGRDILSARPLQALTPLFMRYGVDAVFGGHDEMYEHSVVPGTEILPDGGAVTHAVHYFDVGIGGDGLRGPAPGVRNPHRVFLADSDAPEVWSEDGVLLDGGRHYGHLEVNIERDAEGRWQASMDGVYIFPVTQADGRVVAFERRIYADPVVLTAPR